MILEVIFKLAKMSHTTNDFENDDLNSTSVSLRNAYNVSALCIFVVMSYTFLFPCNKLIPLDRRTVAVLCAVMCYITREYAFKNRTMDIVAAVDFDVLILLSSIMAINHIVVHLQETKSVIVKLQEIIKNQPLTGFWMVSTAAFLVSPFLTNDGVCLLFVEPILNAFEAKTSNSMSDPENQESRLELEPSDAVYFMLTLACSSNIGSALTYTGNPQNMIISEDALSVMPSYLFTGYMLIPSVIAWLITTFWIQYTWLSSKKNNHFKRLSTAEMNRGNTSNDVLFIDDKNKPPRNCMELKITTWSTDNTVSQPSCNTPLSPRRRRAEEQKQMFRDVVVVISSPFPYMILLLLIAMIILIFVDVMSISSLVCFSAIIMIVSLVIGNHWRGRTIWAEKLSSNEGEELLEHGPITDAEKVESMNDFFEELFNSLDYSLLFIFLGTFIVVSNLDSTGLPKYIWDKIVGKIPFRSFGSVLGISIFVLVASQFLGNVAIVQLAKPNVEVLSYLEKKYAWAVISFIATVGGNLTITGSAANIIVCEKSSRIDPNSSIDFFKHFRVCFVVTIVSCCIGSVVLTLLLHA